MSGLSNNEKIERSTRSLMRLLIALRIEKARKYDYWDIELYSYRTLHLGRR